MSANDRVLLDNVLKARRAEIAPDMGEDDFFELFLAEQLMWDRNLSWDEIQTGIIGGQDDGGLDGVYVFCNGDLLSPDAELSGPRSSAIFELVIIQAKTSPGFSEVAVQKIQSTLRNMLDFNKPIEDSAVLYNTQLIAWFTLFRDSYIAAADRFPSVDIKIYYGTRGLVVNEKIATRAQALASELVGLFSACTCAFEFITPSDLVTMARRRRPTTLDLRLTELISSANGGFVGLASIEDYYSFVSTDDGELRTSIFESNVRDYEGNSTINASIKKTLEEDLADDFWWLNNGVTIVASRAAQSRGKVLTLQYPEIVNGLQTSREIYNYLASTDNLRPADDHRTVLIRVVVPTSEVSRDKIIRATNSQTPIPSVALRATDSIQRKIEEYFLQQGWYYERRKNRYQNEGKPISRIVTIPYLAESVLAAVFHTPHLGNPRVGGRFLRDDVLYERIFNDEVRIAYYLKAAQLTRLVERHIQDQTPARKAENQDSKSKAVDLSEAGRISVRDVRANSRGRVRPQRYILPVVTALTEAFANDSGFDSLDISVIRPTDIDYWLKIVEELDPVRTGKRIKNDRIEEQVVRDIHKAVSAAKREAASEA